MNAPFDPSAIGSDISRSRCQHWARLVAKAFVGLMRLNGGGYLTTEIVQQIAPVCTIPIKTGELICRGGHGRLRWRAKTFYDEEPETIEWLNALEADDVFWDVGSNVGLYSIYAALETGCRIYAFEPEAQNFALLMDNLILNNTTQRICATNVPLTSCSGFGELSINAMTKGGAYNQFALESDNQVGIGTADHRVGTQFQFGFSMDDLVAKHGLAHPTKIKIDVDGNEPDIIDGAKKVLSSNLTKSVLIELAPNEARHVRIVEFMKSIGFAIKSRRSNWKSRDNRDREAERPQENVIFERPQ